MGQWIDDVARAVASGVSRREALRRIGGGFAGAMLASLFASEAAAKPDDKVDRRDDKQDKGNDDCTHFCNEAFPPGPERGTCKSDAAHGQGLCFECHRDLRRFCKRPGQSPFCCPPCHRCKEGVCVRVECPCDGECDPETGRCKPNCPRCTECDRERGVCVKVECPCEGDCDPDTGRCKPNCPPCTECHERRGVCVRRDCRDDDPCTKDSCDEATGICRHEPICPSTTKCCPGKHGNVECCPPDRPDCCRGKCFQQCPPGTERDPKTCECRPPEPCGPNTCPAPKVCCTTAGGAIVCVEPCGTVVCCPPGGTCCPDATGGRHCCPAGTACGPTGGCIV